MGISNYHLVVSTSSSCIIFVGGDIYGNNYAWGTTSGGVATRSGIFIIVQDFDDDTNMGTQ